MISCETVNSLDQPDHSSETSERIAVRSLQEILRSGEPARSFAFMASLTRAYDVPAAKGFSRPALAGTSSERTIAHGLAHRPPGPLVPVAPRNLNVFTLHP